MKFYELSPEKRRKQLQEQGIKLNQIDSATLQELDQISENVVGQLRLPLGIVQNLLVNEKNYLVPMAIEEPSVVAAANHGAHLFAKSGGVKAFSQRTGIYGQIVLQFSPKLDVKKFKGEFTQLIAATNAKFASLVKHGGGVRKIEMNCKENLIFLKVLIDPAESMGANRANSILEFMADKLASFPGIVEKLFAILSNYPSQFCTVKVDLDTKLVGGTKIAQRIALLSQIGQDNPYRAVTNNKGIMNGIDAVLLATGNDTRAVEAACGMWAGKTGQYRSLSTWSVQNDRLTGSMTVPLAIGTVGGSINSREDVQQSYRVLGEQITSQELANITAAVGLANNLAALLAIATTGIQDGHMRLQTRNIVASLKATNEEKEAVRKIMSAKKAYTKEDAQQFLCMVREEK